jgi:hypothetical protein
MSDSTWSTLHVLRHRMDLARSRSLIAPALASLFILLALCIFPALSSPSVGIPIPLLRLHPQDQVICDGREIYLQLLDDGTTRINEKQIEEAQLASVIGEIMKPRFERVIYIVPSDGIPYSRFVGTLSTLKMAVPDMHIGVLSGELHRDFMKLNRERRYGPCDYVWPAGTF